MKPILKSEAKLPQYRTINTVALSADYLNQNGISIKSVLHGSGLSPEDLKDPSLRITPECELGILRNIVRLSPEPDLGLKIGKFYHIGFNGEPSLAAMFSDTVMDAIRLSFRLMSLSLTYFQYEFFLHKGQAIVKKYEIIDLQELRRFVCERSFVMAQRMASDLIEAPFPLIEYQIAYPKPSYGDLYEEYFKCPVVFDAPTHQFCFDAGILDLPLPKANRIMRKKYEQECIRLSRYLTNNETMMEKVLTQIRLQEYGYPELETVAKNLNVSARTLRRKLAAEGTTFQAIVSEALKEKSINLLTETDLSVEKIAEQIGYSDTANFYHAFKRWTGKNPSQYR